jgi:hypothetical protein
MTRERYTGDLSGYAPQGYYDPTQTRDGRIVDHDDPRPRIVRSVTLYGHLFGETWWPGGEGQLSITVDLIAESARDVSRSGMVAAIRAAVDGAGDFRSARLTADSFVIVEHRRIGPPDGTVRSWSRRVDVADLPSLSDYVASDTYSYSEVD